jgi:hypothetical protein
LSLTPIIQTLVRAASEALRIRCPSAEQHWPSRKSV